MTQWFSENYGTVLAGAIVLAIVVPIIVKMVKRKRNGGPLVECGGNCSACGGACATGSGIGPNLKPGEKLGLIKTVISIEGMMCGMCESHINDCIRNNFKVKNVYSSHNKGETVVISEEPLDEVSVRKAIDATGYKVTGYVSEEM